MTRIKIVELNKKDWTEQEGLSSKGKRVKGWYERNSDGKLFLYKEPKIFQSTGFVTPEIWTEFIAYKIGNFLNLDVPEVVPAKNEDKQGVLIKSFIKNHGELIDAKEILSKVNEKLYHNLYGVKILLSIDLIDEKAWTNFKKMLIFDCLIGNNDRHDENWGICFNLKSEKAELSPIYDNASCLTNQLDENRVSKMLLDKTLIEDYVKKSRPPNFYLIPTDSNKYTHYLIIKFLLKIKEESDMKDLIAELLQKDYTDYVDDIMANIQQLDVPEEYKLSDNRRKVILEILKLRRQKLKELL